MADHHLEQALNSLGLSALLSRFNREKVNARQITQMSNEDLINLGVNATGDRIRLREMVMENPDKNLNRSRGSGSASGILCCLALRA